MMHWSPTVLVFGILLPPLIAFLLYWRSRVARRASTALLNHTTSQEEPPSLFTHPSVTLSIVVPAYNEIDRLPLMLDESIDFLELRRKENPDFTYEIIVVDDGSKDGTADVAHKHGVDRGLDALRVLRLAENRGKGAAVTQGIMSAKGRYILFADADGATKFSDIAQLEERLSNAGKDSSAVAIGSRAHLVHTEAVVKRSAIRNFLMYSFHAVLYILGIRDVDDTQCGFKLFTRRAAEQIFPNVHVDGWIFDIEVLILAEKRGIPVAEIPVTWHEVDGSKMSLMGDSIRMALDLLIIRLNYALGIWTIKSPGKEE